MNIVFDDIREYAQHHPLSVAAGLIIILPGTYFYVSKNPFIPEIDQHIFSTVLPSIPAFKRTLSSYSPQKSLNLVSIASKSSDESGAALAHQFTEQTRDIINLINVAFEERIGNHVRHWISCLPFYRVLSVTITAALPAICVLSLHQFAGPWASRHQTGITTVLHFTALASFANYGFDTRDLLVAVLVMVAFDVFQRSSDDEAAGATECDESKIQRQKPSVIETPLAQTNSSLGKSDCASVLKKEIFEPGAHGPTLASQSGVLDTKPAPTDSKDREIVRLQSTLTQLRTANKAKEVQLRSAKEELHNARETLNQTFAEYSSLREELKTVKQVLGRDHQAIVYRKDIELFALRKGNEQKEKYIKERDAKLDDMYRQQKATIEVKDAQLKLLKDRLSFMDRQASPKFGHETKPEEDGDHALEVRLLRIRKGKRSPETEEEKDALIAKLQEDLAAATKAADAVVNQQAELQRAWDISKKIQASLKEEREQHAQTKEQLQELTVKLSEAESQGRLQDISGRLPTIDEDEHDTKELEAMFDTAQEDNLRLYAEVEALEKRLRDANVKLFAAAQDMENLREQVRLERAINDDMETARPSVVHRVHFQRMEGQLQESREALAAKQDEIKLLKSTIADKDQHAKDLKGEVDAAIGFHTQDQDEIERLKQSVTELQATKQQLMLDHERLASQRTRQRVVSADRTSARSSDERTPVESLSPMPVVVESKSNESIQMTPRRHLRSESTPNRWSLISNDVPPPELRETKAMRRKSLGLKDLMKRIVRKDTEADKVVETKAARDEASDLDRSRMRNALAPKEKNLFLRPKTATPLSALAKPVTQEATHIPATTANSARPPNSRKNTPRYYATQQAKDDERPKTSTGDDAVRPVSRRSWAATNKLKRRSIY
ncbi:hypothetical protein BKA66DRAFT_257424 [Pyrenochaeta sp. MPI-SDFR-AT-0127]|nr:hypothetical protein BKA66DRAFT_257424 [Pyrenochaeta sp. MPI-SDFR-AT-0127]